MGGFWGWGGGKGGGRGGVEDCWLEYGRGRFWDGELEEEEDLENGRGSFGDGDY